MTGCGITGEAWADQGPDGPVWTRTDTEIHVATQLLDDYPEARAFIEQTYELGEVCPLRPAARHARLRAGAEAGPG